MICEGRSQLVVTNQSNVIYSSIFFSIIKVLSRSLDLSFYLPD
jgi:hypothetical protein